MGMASRAERRLCSRLEPLGSSLKEKIVNFKKYGFWLLLMAAGVAVDHKTGLFSKALGKLGL